METNTNPCQPTDPEKGDEGSIVKVPNEIWAKIFAFFSGSTVDLVQKRLVCKKWCEVVDAHCAFKIVLNDQKTDPRTFSHLRVKECLIKSLITDLSPNEPIFLENQPLKKLYVWGAISPSNFQTLISNQFHNLKQLSLTSESVSTANLMGTLQEQENGEKLEFCASLENLVMDIQQYYPNLRIVIENMTTIFGFPMPNLKSVTIKFNDWHKTQSQVAFENVMEMFVSFLESHVSMDHLEVYIVTADFISAEYLHHHHQFAPIIPLDYALANINLEARLRQVQLVSIKVTMSKRQVNIWIALIRVQRSLKTLHVKVITNEPDMEIYWIPEMNMIDSFQEMFQRNKTSLVSIKLKNFLLSKPELNAKIFCEMSKLKQLSLEPIRHDSDPQNHIINLRKLPNTIEELRLGGMICESRDLLEMAENLARLKFLHIATVGRREGYGVTQGILNTFSELESIQRMTLCPAVLERLNHTWVGDDLHVHLNDMFVMKTCRARWEDQIHFDFAKARKETRNME